MSLDIWLTDTVETTVVDKNITHNLGRMWVEAGIHDVLYNSEGKTAQSVLPILHKGLRLMIAEPERFKKFDPPNGWGTYKHALPWLSDLINEFEEYPNGIIGVSK
jgi:hypothetical protein